MRTLLLFLILLFIALPLAAQDTAGLPDNITVTFEDDFEAGGLATSWDVWGHFPQTSGGHMVMLAWRSWRDAVVRNGISSGEGIMQLFRYEPGQMEFFFDFSDFESPDYRQVRLGTAGNNRWNVFSSSGVRGQQSRTYSSVQLAPGVWYYILLLVSDSGAFHFQLWEPDNADELLLNVSVKPSGTGWTNHEWSVGNKVFDGTLEVDWFAEVAFDPVHIPPCTVRGIGTVNLRSGPGTEFERNSLLDSDREVRVQAQTTGADSLIWWQLANGLWVRSDVARPSGQCSSLPPAP